MEKILRRKCEIGEKTVEVRLEIEVGESERRVGIRVRIRVANEMGDKTELGVQFKVEMGEE